MRRTPLPLATLGALRRPRIWVAWLTGRGVVEVAALHDVEGDQCEVAGHGHWGGIG